MPSVIESIPSVPVATNGNFDALILVVDDNKMNRDVLSRRLAGQGYSVVMAENGRAALEIIRTQDFDLVLLDIMMPEIDGFEVLRTLKSDESLHHIPVVMISAVDALESIVKCVELGAEDYLLKPFDPTLLKARVGATLAKKQAHDREKRLHAELQESHERLKELEQVRDDLTHMIIHDLRTPLASVISGMRTLEALGGLDRNQLEIVEIATSGGDTLLGMINDLLDVDKIESGAMQLDYVLLDAQELMSSAVTQVTPLAAEGNLQLEHEVDPDLPPFYGDEEKLRRVLVNLLGNAIKFSGAGGTVTTAIRLGGDKKSLEFSICDTGQGIPTEAFDKIFEKFGQAGSHNNGRTPGTGLGLTFCKLTTEAHGGHIGVASSSGKGTTLSFTIPCAIHSPVAA
jgi:signal transduction histidine kinase